MDLSEKLEVGSQKLGIRSRNGAHGVTRSTFAPIRRSASRSARGDAPPTAIKKRGARSAKHLNSEFGTRKAKCGVKNGDKEFPAVADRALHFLHSQVVDFTL